MDIHQIEHLLCTFIEKELLDNSISVSADTLLIDLGIESLSIIELVLYAERTFNIELPDSIFTRDNLKSPTTFAHCLQSYINK